MAIATTFEFRGSHPVPDNLPDPPPGWDVRYRRMAADERLRWKELADVLAAARAFLDPVLAGSNGMWDPEAWVWR